MSEKVPYEPIETKRFHVNNDVFSRERIKFLKQAHDVLKQELGETSIAFVGWGSLVKGKILDSTETAKNSDVDLGIFFDEQTWCEHLIEYVKKSEKLEGIVRTQILELMQYYKKERDPIHSWFSRNSKEKFGDDFFELPVESQIQRYLEKITTGALQLELESLVQSFTRQIIGSLPSPKNMKIEIWSGATAYTYKRFLRYFHAKFINVERESSDGSYAQLVAKFLGLDIGGGMKKMRKDFFDHLAQEPKREKLWQQIRFVNLRDERDGYVPEQLEKHFPMKFEDAYKYYTGTPLMEK